MALSAKKNRGEWSELYVLARVLATGEIRSENQTTESPAFPVLSVIRYLNGANHVFRITDGIVQVIGVNDNKVRNTVSQSKLSAQAELLLNKIASGKGRAFAISEADVILTELGLEKVTGSTEKTDLTISLYDPRINQESDQGFSIKSFIGSKPTLLNASGVTNFDYKILQNLTNSEAASLNLLGPIELVSTLNQNGYDIQPLSMDERFKENLKMIDSEMDTLLAEIVLASYAGKGRKMSDILGILVERNPLSYPETNCQVRYTHKIKDLLEAVALGMRPSEPWTGQTEAKGGNLIVTSTGKILCYHALDKDSLRTHLFENTFIDTPSRRRHKFGSITNNVLALNFQIRFR